MSSNSGSSPSITTTTTSAIVTTEKQTTTTTEPTERPPFAVMPMIIKEEPSDYEAMSDITIETNSDENGHIDMPRPSLMNGPIIARQKEKRSTPLVRSLMVAVNDKSLLASSSTSDVDYINAYMQTPSSAASDESPSESTSPTAPRPSTSTAAEATASSSLPNQKQSRATVSRRNEKTLPEKGKSSSVKKPITRQPKASGKNRELKLLQIDLKKVPVIMNGDTFRPSRTSLGKIEPKNYYTPLRKLSEPNITKRKRSVGSTVVGGKHLRDRSNSSHRSSPNGPLRNMNRSAGRQTSAISSIQKNMKNSSRHRSSL